eukprot:SAG31_NODE_905_length_11119_cov_2.887931_11_plen_233_part_00
MSLRCCHHCSTVGCPSICRRNKQYKTALSHLKAALSFHQKQCAEARQAAVTAGLSIAKGEDRESFGDTPGAAYCAAVLHLNLAGCLVQSGSSKIDPREACSHAETAIAILNGVFAPTMTQKGNQKSTGYHNSGSSLPSLELKNRGALLSVAHFNAAESMMEPAHGQTRMSARQQALERFATAAALATRTSPMLKEGFESRRRDVGSRVRRSETLPSADSPGKKLLSRFCAHY